MGNQTKNTKEGIKSAMRVRGDNAMGEHEAEERIDSIP